MKFCFDLPYRRVFSALLVLFSGFLLAPAADAANPDGSLRTEVIAAPNFVVDSNVESPSTYAPRAAYLGATFFNDGAAPLTNVFAFIGNYVDGINDTPGIYPRRAHLSLTGFAPDGKFALNHEGGSAGLSDATRYIGTILPGKSVTVYWLISYPNLDAAGRAVHGPSVKPEDDLWLEYDIWVKGIESGTPRTSVVTKTATMRNEISAMANKIFPNGANKVPQPYLDMLGIYEPRWTNVQVTAISPGTVTALQGFWYDLGNVGHGFDNNGDFVPDKNAWMQPVGDPAIIDAGAFRLVRTYAMVIVKLKTGGEKIITAENQLYFENVPENNGAVGFVGYEYMAVQGPAVARFTPYQEVASGYDNEKFNGDYGAGLPPLTSTAPEITMSKDASVATVMPGGSIQYTVNYTNVGAVAVGAPEVGMPLVVQDAIPSGTRYVAGSAVAANILPSGVAGYTILFSTNNGTSWLTSEPSPAANVTHLQWWLSNPLAPAASGRVSFSVTAANPFTNLSPLIYNEAGLSYGSGAPFLTDDATTLVLGNNFLQGTVYSDTGSGGNFGNGNLDVGEPRLPSIKLMLYSDIDSSEDLSSGDILLATTNSAANGTYIFTNIPDGEYIVAVDTTDVDIPVGYTITTVLERAADLDAARATTLPVSSLNNDFGFAPGFFLDKSIVGSTNLYEGTLVTNTIDLVNRFPGNGDNIGVPATFFVWADRSGTASQQSKAWQNVQNATNAPDGISATAPFASAADELFIAGFPYPQQAGNIAKVELIMVARTNIAFTRASSMTIAVHTNGTQIFSTNVVVTNVFKSGTLTNVYFTVATNLPWSVFSGTVLSNSFIASKSGSDPGQIELDAVGFRVTTDHIIGAGSDATTLNPVPLVDVYDSDLLRFVSADPAPDFANGNTLTWANLGPIYPGGTRQVSLLFEVLQPTGNILTNAQINCASVTEATYGNGKSAGSASDCVSAQVRPSGTIGDFVWRDVDADGIQDAGEYGIPNVSVVLSNRTTFVNVTNRTDANGFYLFTGITNAATYDVKVLTATLPQSFIQTFDRDGTATPNTAAIANFNPAANNGTDTILNADFGYRFTTAAIDGFVWNDLNRSGTSSSDAGEPALSGLSVVLYSGGSPVRTNSTDTIGYYSFTNLAAGTYTVVVTNTAGALAQTGWVQSFDTDGVPLTTNRVTVTLPVGGLQRANYSYYRTGSLSLGDTLFFDIDGDSIQDINDEGIPNVTVILYADLNTNGVVDPSSDPVLATAVTSSTGQYLFNNLAANAYIVKVDTSDPQFPSASAPTKDPDSVKDSKSSLVLTASNLNQDFGYQPFGTGTIGDTVWFDLDGDGVQDPGETGFSNITVSLYTDRNGDGTFVGVGTTSTGVGGLYSFPNLAAGNYRVIVDTNDVNLPSDAFGNRYVLTTASQKTIALAPGGTDLTADFGFIAPSAIGDTIFWDANSNGTQDWNEIGASNVTVKLYFDVNTNRVYDLGEPLVASDVTTTNGTYLFTHLVASNYVVVVDQANGPLAGATITADPNTDGEPCSGNCDGQYGRTIGVGVSFMGADFGYQPRGVIGDAVWIDIDNDGVFGANEVGIPFVTVELRNSLNNLVAVTSTDPDGYYLFTSVTNGSYKVVVVTSDPDFPLGLSLTHDPDGGTPHESNLTITDGGSNLSQDFGYRYSGNNLLSGTIGLDALPYDGVLGTNALGVASNEVAFADLVVSLYRWIDAGDGSIGAGETELIASTITDDNGDYSFSGLPNAARSNYFLVSVTAPYENLRMSTQTGHTPALAVVRSTNSFGDILSAYQVVTNQSISTNIDFAFYSTVDYDFGDLPDSYRTSLAQDGPRHVVAETPNLYLGLAVDTEDNALPSPAANSDGSDEDGIALISPWVMGTDGGSVSVTVGAGSGWLVGWIDFDRDGSFADADEMIVSQSVSVGTGNVTFDVPANTFSPGAATTLAARFRLFTEQPLFPSLAFTGEADNGEVEDYLFAFGAIGDYVWNDQNGNGLQEGHEAPISGVRVFVDLNGDFAFQSNEPFSVTSGSGAWNIGGLSPATYSVVVDPSTVPAGSTVTGDPDAIKDGRASVILASGAVRSDLDFGYRKVTDFATVNGHVYYDLNGNGTQDNGEANVTNVTVTVTDNGGSIQSVSTDLAGNWSASVAPGLVSADVDTADLDFVAQIPAGYNQTEGTDPTYVTAPAGVTTFAGNDGYYVPATVTGHLYYDVNGDGTQQATFEKNLTNVTVTVYSGTNIVQAVSDAVGNWSAMVPPGQVTNNVDNADADFIAQVTLAYVQTEGTDPSVVTAPAGQTTFAGNDGYYNPTPTLALLASIEGLVEDGVAVVEWVTASEVGTLGFDLYRKTEQGGWVLVNDVLVIANNSLSGGTYRVIDPEASVPGTHVYKLVEWEDDGDEIVIGTYSLTFDSGIRLKVVNEGEQLILEWTGGKPPFRVETQDLTDGNAAARGTAPSWETLQLPDSSARKLVIPSTNSAGFFRVRSGAE